MSSSISLSRRELLAGAAATSFAGQAMAQNAADAPAAAKPAAGISRVRPNLDTPEGVRMLGLYLKAVTAMQAPAINYPPRPWSWIFQAYIHAVPKNPFDPAVSGGLYNGTQALKDRIDQIYGFPAAGSDAARWKEAAGQCWATCTHASPYFTVWHRWYMYYFEQVCRRMCGDQTFQLPYWNYGSDQGSSLQLPPAFQAPTGSNPPPITALYFDDRGLGFGNPQGTGPQNVSMNAGGYMPYNQVFYGPALAATLMFPSDTRSTFALPNDPNYYKLGYSGRLECAPHDMVHNWVGGWMGNVPSAAGDPIFYMHHCQIDRLYASWEALQGRQYNYGNTDTDPSEATWRKRSAYFVDAEGQPKSVALASAMDISSLGYKYDLLAQPSATVMAQGEARKSLMAAAPTLTLASSKAAGFSVGAEGTTVMLAPSGPPRTKNLAASNGSPEATTLVLSGMRLIRRPPAPLSVFLNLPKGTMPELNDAFYIGTLNLFNFDLDTGTFMSHDASENGGMGVMNMEAEFRFDVTEVLQKQRSKGLWNEHDISVTVTTIGNTSASNVTYVTFTGASLEP